MLYQRVYKLFTMHVRLMNQLQITRGFLQEFAGAALCRKQLLTLGLANPRIIHVD